MIVLHPQIAVCDAMCMGLVRRSHNWPADISHFGLTEGVANAFRFGISNGQAAKLGCVTLYSLCSRESGTAGFIEEGPDVLVGQILWVVFPVEEELWGSTGIGAGLFWGCVNVVCRC